ncbi:hypothetical protein [Acaryochloris sp. IP29b_bin.148]|uniref:hypothetical protein n=1 Tax=Acaryochloris sp. IP29b_bin.148 TaxID=2969218 RepID=UPI002619A722|nr:hypothetical protein [Acaryochloris sp. IP29b_bin.148]
MSNKWGLRALLKFNYSKQGTILESVTAPLEDVINRRVLLAVRTAQPIHVEPSFVSLVVPSALPELRGLATELAQGDCDAISLCAMEPDVSAPSEQPLRSDEVNDNIEVVLRGLWLTHHPEAEEGIFFTSLTSEIEEHIEELWSYQPRALP